jgi:hypothetical protein
VTEEAIGEVTGPSAIAYSRGQEAVTIDDFLVTKDGGNALLPQPLASAFGTLELISGGKTKVVDIAAFAAAHPQSAYSLGTVPGETPYDSDPYDVIALPLRVGRRRRGRQRPALRVRGRAGIDAGALPGRRRASASRHLREPDSDHRRLQPARRNRQDHRVVLTCVRRANHRKQASNGHQGDR